MRQFPVIPPTDPAGVLIVYGEEKPENAGFVRSRDIMSQDFAPGGRDPVMKFQGEVKFTNELGFLMGGKEKPVVCFTQGAGEFDLNDSAKRTGLGQIKERLQRRNFDVQPLTLEPVDPKVPENGKYVVIAGPIKDYPPASVAALDRFVKGGGRLVALLDVPDTREKTMPATGLEGILGGYGVEVTTERILALPNRQVENTEVVLAAATTESEDNPIVAAFQDLALRFDRCRIVRPAAQGPNPNVRATTLLAALPQFGIWAEPDMQASGEQIAKSILATRDTSKLSRQPLPIAVTVTESPPGNPMTGERPKPAPKLIVVGDATFITNGSLSGQGASIYPDLFASMLEWLRDKPQNIGVEPRTFQTFEMNADAPQRASQLAWLPMLASVVTIGGLGASVWVARRR
jgi:hypothetical protein